MRNTCAMIPLQYLGLHFPCLRVRWTFFHFDGTVISKDTQIKNYDQKESKKFHKKKNSQFEKEILKRYNRNALKEHPRLENTLRKLTKNCNTPQGPNGERPFGSKPFRCPLSVHVDDFCPRIPMFLKAVEAIKSNPGDIDMLQLLQLLFRVNRKQAIFLSKKASDENYCF